MNWAARCLKPVYKSAEHIYPDPWPSSDDYGFPAWEFRRPVQILIPYISADLKFNAILPRKRNLESFPDPIRFFVLRSRRALKDLFDREVLPVLKGCNQLGCVCIAGGYVAQALLCDRGAEYAETYPTPFTFKLARMVTPSSPQVHTTDSDIDVFVVERSAQLAKAVGESVLKRCIQNAKENDIEVLEVTTEKYGAKIWTAGTAVTAIQIILCVDDSNNLYTDRISRLIGGFDLGICKVAVFGKDFMNVLAKMEYWESVYSGLSAATGTITLARIDKYRKRGFTISVKAELFLDGEAPLYKEEEEREEEESEEEEGEEREEEGEERDV